MSNDRLIGVEIDDETLGASGPDAEHERRVAIFDLLESNSFKLLDKDQGPYLLVLSKIERRLVFAVRDEKGNEVHTFILSLGPFRGVIRDYFMICDSYYDAIRTQTPHQIEAIDMARRGIHNEGSELLAERLEGKVHVDFQTARRLFTLICALHAGQTRSAG
ncbi:hypothetical protein HY29_04850 [Hyphomonas beringensis]|uniref:UPF0262 protein HY29_04850 n=1 Tax=Hyphomonas beringensis TaxID=1280946 RepID=A0A062TX58_9PROT|nr:UPF0262 family protein [Hyphomonas beringensis]KCZ52611.1 hypothetical protein HY29_04850 [Hyphomonas beringensis]